MAGYLLDTNHVSAVCDRVAKVLEKVGRVPDSQLRACVITLGEVEAGHKMTRSTNQERRDKYTQFLNTKFLPNAIAVSTATRLYYADIIGAIWAAHPPPRRRKTERHLVELGVDINDVWIAAVAIEHGLILLTGDKMSCIREATEGKLRIESWL